MPGAWEAGLEGGGCGTRASSLTHHTAPGAVARSPPYKSRDNDSDSMAGTPMGRLAGKPGSLAGILLHTFPSGRAGASLQTPPRTPPCRDPMRAHWIQLGVAGSPWTEGQGGKQGARNVNPTEDAQEVLPATLFSRMKI